MNIQLRLNNSRFKRRFLHTSTKETNERRLYFEDAWVIFGTLRVGNKVKDLRHGGVHVSEGTPPEKEFAAFSFIGEYQTDDGAQPDCFEARVHLPTDAFNHLLYHTAEDAIIYLWLEFGEDGNIKWEPYGDDGERFWDISSDYAFEVAEKVDLAIFERLPEDK